MAQFPESPIPSYSLVITPKWTTLKTQLGNKFEQRTAKQLYPQFDVTVTFDAIFDHDNVMVLWDFYQARKGSYEGFHIYDPRLQGAIYPAYTGLYIGTSDGATLTYDIPGRSTSGQTIYADGVDQVANMTILTGGGTSSSDRVEFTTAPTTGDIITCDFTGIMRIPVRFKNDKLSFEWFKALMWKTGSIELEGLRFG